MRVLPVILLSLVGLQQVTPQQISDAEFDARTADGINYIYNLEFEKADQVFLALSHERPRHPAGQFFLAMVNWWRIMIDPENRQYDDQFFDQLDKVSDLCDELLGENDRDVTALFFKGGALGFQGRLKFQRDDWFGAANAGRKALPLVQDAFAADPKNDDIFLGTGIYNYYAVVIPEQYPVAKPLLLFIPPGDKKKGLEQLQHAADHGKYSSIEAKYFLMQLYFLYERDFVKGLALAIELHDRFPNNMLFHKYVGRFYALMGNYPSAREVWSEIATHVQEGKRGYNDNVSRETEYYLGLCDLNSRSYDSALNHFYRCDELSRIIDTDGASGFMVMTNLNIGKIYDIQSKRDLAIEQYKKVLSMKEYRDSYDQSERLLKAPYAH